jgi:FtsP/CotA-like multicopper oxidase with cupredoxin domain
MDNFGRVIAFAILPRTFENINSHWGHFHEMKYPSSIVHIDVTTMLHSSFLLAASFLAQTISAATLTYNWDITWVQANPDHRLQRPVIGINGQWPNPAIQATLGDNLVVNVNNKLGNESVTIHWHGIFQVGNNNNDGPPGKYLYKFYVV